MDDDEFDAWKICWAANLLFHKVVTDSQKCIVCSEINSWYTNTRRSLFWLEATQCSAGHRQATKSEMQRTPHPGVCATCDPKYMLEVVKGKHTCRMEGCRRGLRVHETDVKEKLASDKKIMEDFLSLVQKCRVYECAIHCDEVAYDSDPLVAFTPPTADCDHDRKVCDLCLKTTFESAIRGGRLQDLVCPDPDCKKSISLKTVRQNVSTDVFKMYNKQLALKTLSQDERFRWCTCGHGQIHETGESNPEWKCLSCKKRHCYICREESSSICHHLHSIDSQKLMKKTQQREAALRLFSEATQRASREAQEAERRARENDRRAREQEAEATRREIARITKKCPKARCGNKIERNEGCGHFTCRKCQTDFCWSCKVIWKGGKALHLRGCRIGTTSTIAKEYLDTSEYAVGWDKDRGYDLRLDHGLWLIDSQQ